MGLSLFLQSTARVIPTNQLPPSAIQPPGTAYTPRQPRPFLLYNLQGLLTPNLLLAWITQAPLVSPPPLVSFGLPCSDNSSQKIPKFYLLSKDLGLNTQDRRKLAGTSDPL